MKAYTLHRDMGYCPIRISGDDIINAIKNNFQLIAKEANIGNAAGFRLQKVVVSYNAAILGGKGGAEVIITATGAPLAHNGDVGAEKNTKVWISGVNQAELPMPYEFLIN